MARYIERKTKLEVDVTCVQSYRGEPYAAIVTMPNGMRYSLPSERVDRYFEIVTPQHIMLEAIGSHEYDRTTPPLTDKPED